MAAPSSNYDGYPENRELFTNLLDALPSPVFYKGVDGIYYGCNCAFEELLGLSRDEIIGKTVYDLAPKELADTYHARDAELFAHPGTQAYESSIRVADGSQRDVVFNKATYSDAKGNVAGLIGVITDVTEQKRVHEQLRLTKERYESLVENIPGAVYRCANDANWTMAYLSDQIEVITGYPASHFINNRERSYASVIHPDDRTLVDEAVSEGVHKHEPFVIYYRIIDADGKVKHVYEKGSGVYDQDGKLVWIDGAIFDNTEHQRAAAAERNADRLGLVRDMATGIAHNFNNLLSGVRGYAELVRTKLKEADMSTADIDTVIEISTRAARLAGQVRMIAESEHDVYTSCDLNELVQILLAQREPNLPEGVTLHMRLPTDPVIVRAAEDKIDILLRHLMDNAVDAMPSGGTLTVALGSVERATEAGPQAFATLEVTDTGLGMDPKTAKRAFTPFSSSKQTVGVGLSLAVVQGIVRAHEGKIELETRPGRGTTVRVLLPIATPEAKAQND